jgi:nicotinic acid mononucleotide adenylyltransferase
MRSSSSVVVALLARGRVGWDAAVTCFSAPSSAPDTALCVLGWGWLPRVHSVVRRQLRGGSVKYLVPDAVAAYIAEHDLASKPQWA